MAGSNAARARVQRFLQGSFRTEDLTRLFLWLRHRAPGIASVTEIGHCVAHPDERVIGPVTDSLRLFCFNILYNCQALYPRTIDRDHLPAEFEFITRNNLQRIDRDTLYEKTGLKRQAAYTHLQSGLGKLAANPDGSKRLAFDLTEAEAKVLTCCFNCFAVGQFVTADQLWNDFCLALELNKVLLKTERKELRKIRPALLLFTVATLHGVRIMLRDQWFGYLAAVSRKKEIVIDAVVPYPHPKEDGNIFIRFEFLNTYLSSTTEWSDIALASIEPSKWNSITLELRDDMKLTYLQ